MAEAAKPFTIDELLQVRRVCGPAGFARREMGRLHDRRYRQGRESSHDPNISCLFDRRGAAPAHQRPQSSSSPRWSPDGKRLAFVSAARRSAEIGRSTSRGERAEEGHEDLDRGGRPRLVARRARCSPSSRKSIPECADDDCNKKRAEQAAESKVQAKIADRLLYRHWTSWKEGSARTSSSSRAKAGRRATLRRAITTRRRSLWAGPPDYSFSPDSKEIAFARNTDKVEATSTNGDIFLVPVAGGEARRITGDNFGDGPVASLLARRAVPRLPLADERRV